MWATALPASDGVWWARATGISPGHAPISYRVTGVYPLQTAACSECNGIQAPVTIEPDAAVPVTPRAHLPGTRMIAGAFAIETTGPLAIDLVAYRSGEAELRQRLDVARRWVAPGRHQISAVERAGADWRMNLFVVNPGDTPVADVESSVSDVQS